MRGPTRTNGQHPVLAQLRELRRAAGLSLSQLERASGIRGTVAGSWERGDRHPPVEAIQRLLDVYGYRLIAVPHHRLDGQPVIRTPKNITAVLRDIADQLDPDKPQEG